MAIDPDFVLAREYLGEGYVAAGKFDLAREQLREIGNRCGTNCEEYMELAEVISRRLTRQRLLRRLSPAQPLYAAARFRLLAPDDRAVPVAAARVPRSSIQGALTR